MGTSFQPYISASESPKELTFRAVVIGLVFGVIFAVANAYLALKIGTTISASIPAAIVSMALFKIFFRRASILENNLVQTAATVGEALAAGVVFTIPALILLGEPPSIGQIFLLSLTGGILGILLMIPMRRFVIVEEHGELPFPEGTACAAILKAGAKRHPSARFALWGALIGAGYKLMMNALFLWEETFTWNVPFFRKVQVSVDTTPALLGVGYMIGPKITLPIFAGGAFAWWMLIPFIGFIGEAGLGPEEIWDESIRYIGAGALTFGGLYNLAKIFPLLYKTVHLGVKDVFSGFGHKGRILRTERDIPLFFLVLGALGIILFLWLFPAFPMNLFTVILLAVLAFFFSAVTCVTVGIVGTTSNPVSGMTITTLLITCLIFAFLGWTERIFLVSAITMGCVSCCAIAMAGTTAQDLKTGYLLGATPWMQQWVEILGAILPSLALGYTVYLLDAAYRIGSNDMPAPQATLMSMIAQGVISGDLPYTLVGVGCVLAAVMTLLRVPVLPFALGVYLPLSLSTAMMVGGLMRSYVDRKQTSNLAEERGILLSSGLIGGDACIGVIVALLTVLGKLPAHQAGFLPFWVTPILYGYLAQRLSRMLLKKTPG